MTLAPSRVRLAVCAALLSMLGSAGVAQGCELLLTEHRSGRELARLVLDAQRPEVRVAFTHSVLGTPVSDRYRWQGQRWHLREERFEGQGYGLPYRAGDGEILQRVGGETWQLLLDRVVQPLVVRPLPAQSMRVQVGDGPALLLGALSQAAVELRARGC